MCSYQGSASIADRATGGTVTATVLVDDLRSAGWAGIVQLSSRSAPAGFAASEVEVEIVLHEGPCPGLTGGARMIVPASGPPTLCGAERLRPGAPQAALA